jgi:hypothetical protein
MILRKAWRGLAFTPVPRRKELDPPRLAVAAFCAATLIKIIFLGAPRRSGRSADARSEAAYRPCRKDARALAAR